MSSYIQAASKNFCALVEKIPVGDGEIRGMTATGFTGLTGAATGRLLMGSAFTLPAGAICAYAAVISVISLVALAKLGVSLSEGIKVLGFTVLPITTTLLLSSAVGVPLTMALLLSVQNTFSIALGLYAAWYIC